MRLSNEQIEYSKKDILKKIKIPIFLTAKLAEIIGIILGDGHLEYNKRYSNNVVYLIQISGNSSDDIDYYKNEINMLFYSLFNTKFKIFFRKNNELDIRLYSKAIATFIKNLGIKPGKKVEDNEIPPIILSSDKLIKRNFLKGVFDTDGSIAFKKDYFKKHSKPIISLTMKSFNFILQTKKILDELGLMATFYKDEYFDKRIEKKIVRYRLELVGKEKIGRYLKIIGFRNPKHLTKIDIWKKFGFCPPYTNLKQRKEILNGKLNSSSFY